MILVFLTVFSVFCGSSAGFPHEEECYGGNFKLPFGFAPPLYSGPLYFTPSDGGPKKLLLDNGEVKDPRLEISLVSSYLHDLTEKDDGSFSISYDSDFEHTIATLTILDCAEEITQYYGSMYNYPVPIQAEFLEFTPIHSLDRPKILWNRTNPQANTGSRGRVKKNVWKISDLTQDDNGYYNFRRKDNKLESRLLLTVQEYSRNYKPKVDERLFIEYLERAETWIVTFTPEAENEPATEMKGSEVLKDDWFFGRILGVSEGVEVDPVYSSDSGTFEFRDLHGNLAVTAQVKVDNATPPALVYVIIVGVLVVLGVLCWCCFRCKKKRAKRHKAASQSAAAPAVYHHDEHQPTGLSYVAPSVFSHQPINSRVPKDPTSLELPVYHPVNIHVNPSQPEVALPGGRESAPGPSVSSDFLSSEPEPRFELKGLSSLSAPLLSSDSTFCDVYNSDKLNFL